MHPLDNVPAIVKDTPNVLRVHSAGEMWIAVMLAVTRCCRNAKKLVPYEIFGPDHLQREENDNVVNG